MQGVRVAAIGITQAVSEEEINAIATNPDNANAIFVRDFRDLPGIVDSIATLACGKGKALCRFAVVSFPFFQLFL